MKQTATLKIEIPNGHQWTVSDLKKAIKDLGIKCKVTACVLGLKIPKRLVTKK